ncbi:MAG: TraU family protein, partial [Chlamydiia bacterium]|nr:TraU family protein [Chlamydiia bacterium]
YKTQLTYPIAQTKGPCNALGRSDVLWGGGKSFPYGGEDFVYLIWTKKHCCLDPYKIAKKVAAGS